MKIMRIVKEVWIRLEGALILGMIISFVWVLSGCPAPFESENLPAADSSGVSHGHEATAAQMTATTRVAGTQTTKTKENPVKHLSGKVTLKDLDRPEFAWFAEGRKSARTRVQARPEIGVDVQGVHWIIFMGTWCSDTREALPEFVEMNEALGVSESKMEFWSYDLNEPRAGKMKELGVDRFPTFIAFRGDQEIGRIIETPKKTIIEDVLQILAR